MWKKLDVVRAVCLAAALTIFAMVGCAATQTATAPPAETAASSAEPRLVESPDESDDDEAPIAGPNTPSVAYAMASLRIAPGTLAATPDDLAVDPTTLRNAALVIETAEGDEEGKEALDPGLLTVRVLGLRNSDGVVRVAVYNSGDGFPKNRNAVVDSQKLSIREGADSVETTFDLEPGTYAVAILHDENESGGMDYNGLGMPTEGYGASLNPSSSLGAPSWNDSKFDLGDHKVVSIKVVYF